jgi:3-hydroxybutyryl-CoA dehydrogenase
VAALPRHVAVAGAGTMGAGIAAAFAAAGCEVRLHARREESLAGARSRLPGIWATLGVEDSETAEARMAFTTDPEAAVRGSDLVIETIAEATAPKIALLALAERFAPDAVLVSNTSSLPLEELAQGLARPERFAAYHWFNPPELMPIVEIVAAARTDPEVIASLRGWTEALGRAPIVLAKDTPGFVANRLQLALLREAFALVEDGVCGFAEVDRAVTHGLGPRWSAIGPFQGVDMAGVDIYAEVSKNLFPLLSTEAGVPPALVKASEAGALGAKAGRGLLGEYGAEELAAIARWRLEVVSTIGRLRRERG